MCIVHPTVICDRDIISTSIYTPLSRWVRVDIVSATVPSSSRFQLLERGKEKMMLLLDYAKSKGILKTRIATVVEVRDNGGEITLLYKVDGQKYVNGQPSARTMSKKIADAVEVDKDTGRIISGNILKKNNFWVWEPGIPEDTEDEA